MIITRKSCYRSGIFGTGGFPLATYSSTVAAAAARDDGGGAHSGRVDDAVVQELLLMLRLMLLLLLQHHRTRTSSMRMVQAGSSWSELLRALRFSCASLWVWARPHSFGDTPPTPARAPTLPGGYWPAQTSTSATPLSRFSLLLARVPRADFCRSSSASMRSVSISSISLIDSRRSSANLHRSCSLRALNVTSTFPSTFCDSRMQN
uniref:Uncharacterized protein n=1 Tax=Anopheles atroparvus TaxID=41427 RepID=A0A182JGD5_ANOAO